MWKFVCWGLGMVFAVLAVVSAVKAQEQPQKPHKQWQLGWVPLGENDAHEYDAKVTVIDTEGVCLYVVTGHREKLHVNVSHADTIALGVTTAITAVPKTQLPKGAGCQ